jgi:hypothetical protein
MREPAEMRLEARAAESADVQTLVNMTGSPDLRLGRLFLLVFVINIAVAMLAWLLVGLIEWMTFGW